MASIGIDIPVASIAKRLSQDPPENLQAKLIVQRASVYIENNLVDLDLDPTRFASAIGVSLCYLQELFQAQDRNIADWIWRRRLEVAAQRLSNPGLAHVVIGALAYGCGFSNQSHFCRRFKDRYELVPSDYRWRALSLEIGREAALR